MSSDPGWVSWEAAAKIAGCNAASVHRAVVAGEIVRRQGLSRAVPSLQRESVEAWTAQRRASAARTEARRAHQDARRNRPPDDGEVWLSAVEVSLMLGFSTGRVDQLARVDRLPNTMRGRRRWFRRLHIERSQLAKLGVDQVSDLDRTASGGGPSVVAT